MRILLQFDTKLKYEQYLQNFFNILKKNQLSPEYYSFSQKKIPFEYSKLLIDIDKQKFEPIIYRKNKIQYELYLSNSTDSSFGGILIIFCLNKKEIDSFDYAELFKQLVKASDPFFSFLEDESIYDNIHTLNYKKGKNNISETVGIDILKEGITDIGYYTYLNNNISNILNINKLSKYKEKFHKGNLIHFREKVGAKTKDENQIEEEIKKTLGIKYFWQIPNKKAQRLINLVDL